MYNCTNVSLFLIIFFTLVSTYSNVSIPFTFNLPISTYKLRVIPPVPFFFLKIALAIQDFLYFHTNLEIICSSSVKNTAGSLIGIGLNL